MHRETEDRVECRHWVETPVEPEHKFVEVSLQVLMTNSVMRAEQPSLQIREGDVDHRQVCIRSLRVTIQHQGLVRVTQLGQIIVALPTVGVHNSALCHRFSHEPRESLGTAVWHKAQSQSARADGSLGLFAIGAGRPWAYLDGSNDRRLMVDAVSLALCTAANKRLIHFDRILGSDSVALWSHHAGAQLVEHLKSCLVAGHAQLRALVAPCRRATCGASEKLSRSGTCPVAAETAEQTGRASVSPQGKHPRTIQPAACDRPQGRCPP